MGMCGGINNPVHYVRVKLFTSWITGIMEALVGKSEVKKVCWIGGPVKYDK